MTRPFALVIEDDPNLGAIFVKTLARAGFETALDADGNRYPAMIAAQKPALVVVDFHLPFATGEQIVNDLRARYPASEVLLLVVTADLYRAKALQAQGEIVLIKPVSPTRLLEIISLYIHPEKGQTL